jgi:hypothetical protein
MTLVDKIRALKIPHHYCDADGWYSCPKHPEGCLDPYQTQCNCGADAHNRRVEELAKFIDDNMEYNYI